MIILTLQIKGTLNSWQEAFQFETVLL